MTGSEPFPAFPMPGAISKTAKLTGDVDVISDTDVRHYLAQYGFEANSSKSWRDSPPEIRLRVSDHQGSGDGHTLYTVICGIPRPSHWPKPPFEPSAAVAASGSPASQAAKRTLLAWRAPRRLCQLRSGLHDIVKETLASAYQTHFNGTPFAHRMAPPGTTKRLDQWLQRLGQCISMRLVSPRIAAQTLKFLGAPAPPTNDPLPSIALSDPKAIRPGADPAMTAPAPWQSHLAGSNHEPSQNPALAAAEKRANDAQKGQATMDDWRKEKMEQARKEKDDMQKLGQMQQPSMEAAPAGYPSSSSTAPVAPQPAGYPSSFAAPVAPQPSLFGKCEEQLPEPSDLPPVPPPEENVHAEELQLAARAECTETALDAHTAVEAFSPPSPSHEEAQGSSTPGSPASPAAGEPFPVFSGPVGVDEDIDL